VGLIFKFNQSEDKGDGIVCFTFQIELISKRNILSADHSYSNSTNRNPYILALGIEFQIRPIADKDAQNLKSNYFRGGTLTLT